MSTTSIIVEMLIIGFFTAIWIFLLCLRFSFFDFSSVQRLIHDSGNWSTAGLFMLAAAFYQLGLLTNSLSYKITVRFANKEGLRDRIIGGVDYEKVKAVIWHKGSTDTVRYIENNLTFVRLARSGILNFLLISIALFSFGQDFYKFGILTGLIFLACIPLWQFLYVSLYYQMKFAYETIMESDVAPGSKPGSKLTKTR